MKAFKIAFEGSDGAGKETQTSLLTKVIFDSGKKVGRVSFPRYQDTVGGNLLHHALGKDKNHMPDFSFANLDPYAASLIYAADRRESLPFLNELIANSDVLVFDRYVESNLLHQGGKFKTDDEREKFGKWLFNLEYGMLDLPSPQLTIYLSLPWEVSEARAKARAQGNGLIPDLVEMDKEYLRASHSAGQFYAKHFGWTVIDCYEYGRELSRDEIHKKVLAAPQIKSLLGGK